MKIRVCGRCGKEHRCPTKREQRHSALKAADRADREVRKKEQEKAERDRVARLIRGDRLRDAIRIKRKIMVFLLRANGASLEETAKLVRVTPDQAQAIDEQVAGNFENAWRLFQIGDGPWIPGVTLPWEANPYDKWLAMGPPVLSCAPDR